MRAIFPRKWDDQFSTTKLADQCAMEWAEGISNLSDKQLARGVSHVRKSFTWPPSIAEFRKACIGDWQQNAQNVINHKALPKPDLSDEKVAAYVLAAKRMLNKHRTVPATSETTPVTKPEKPEDPQVVAQRRQKIIQEYIDLGFDVSELGLTAKEQAMVKLK